LPPESGDKQLGEPASSSADEVAKKAPPRLRQPARGGNVLPAPKAELQAHKAAFRKLFGETLSDEFVDEMLTRLDLALAPGHWDVLEPGTLNAAIALIASINPQTELEALLAVQIVATGFAGLKLMQRGQSHLEEAYISVYGGYGTRLLRALERRDHDHRSGRARGGPARGGSLDAHRALNDREPERHARLEPRPLAAAAVVRQNLDYGRTIVIAASMPR